MRDPCPDLDRLRQLVEETLPAADQEAMQAHLERCEECQRRLEKLAANQGSWARAARHLGEPAPEAPTGPALHRMMSELRAPGRPPDGADADDLALLGPGARPGSLGRLGHYEIVEVLGRGGFGVVYKAHDDRLARAVAIKVLSRRLAGSPSARRGFTDEARAAAAVSHDHVVGIHAVEEANGVPYIVMQLVAGQSLQERVDHTGPLGLKEVLRIGMQTAAGLAAAHAQGLVHRDIKPANILLENGVERVKITDFGLATALDEAGAGPPDGIAGTPMYMAPEQAAGEAVDHRADLFSLGSVLYTLCTGRPPFRARADRDVLQQVREATPRPIPEINPGIPDWLWALIGRLHAKKPADRFQTAEEVAEVLGQYLAHLQRPGPLPAAGPGACDSPPPRSFSPTARALLAGLGVGLLFAATSGMGAQSSSEGMAGDGPTVYRQVVQTVFVPDMALAGFFFGALIGGCIGALWRRRRLGHAAACVLLVGVGGWNGMVVSALVGKQHQTTVVGNSYRSASWVPLEVVVAGAVVGLALGALGAWLASRQPSIAGTRVAAPGAGRWAPLLLLAVGLILLFLLVLAFLFWSLGLPGTAPTLAP
jgi:serine/threonine-protein kinase